MEQLPLSIKNSLINFLSDIPVEKFSKDWQAIQIAIAMIMSPESFKKGVHVYMESNDISREPGCYDIRKMFIKIWPHKIHIRRKHSEYNSYSDLDRNVVCRYMFPHEKYHDYNFREVMSDMGELFRGNYSESESDYSGHYSTAANFKIETNIIIK